MPINPKAKLAKDVLNVKTIKRVATRDGYGQGLLESGTRDKRVVAVCADLVESTRTEDFAKKFPDRFIEVGVAEQNLITVASGLASYGKIPFAASYAAFSPGRNWEQIRTTICYNNVPVKIVGSHAGLSVGPDGATHQAIEDIATTRVLANMTVISPSDMNEAYKATLASVTTSGPVYLRLCRENTPVFTTSKTPFKVGRAEIFFDYKGKPDVVIVATGPLVYEALIAADILEKQGRKVRVLNLHTIKPIDKVALIKSAKDAGAIVTVEEHQIYGGMGSAVVEVLSQSYPVPVEFIGINDKFGESGQAKELLEKFNLTAPSIVKAAQRAIRRKS